MLAADSASSLVWWEWDLSIAKCELLLLLLLLLAYRYRPRLTLVVEDWSSSGELWILFGSSKESERVCCVWASRTAQQAGNSLTQAWVVVGSARRCSNPSSALLLLLGYVVLSHNNNGKGAGGVGVRWCGAGSKKQEKYARKSWIHRLYINAVEKRAGRPCHSGVWDFRHWLVDRLPLLVVCSFSSCLLFQSSSSGIFSLHSRSSGGGNIIIPLLGPRYSDLKINE